jgi:hypothetical protein
MTKKSRKDTGGDNTPVVPLVRARKSVAKYGLAELAKQINKAYDNLLMTSAERAIRVGELLLAAKERVFHGEWQDWVRANTRITPASARGYMHLARQPEAKRKQICVLGLRQALDATVERLAGPDAPVHEMPAVREVPVHVRTVTQKIAAPYY